MMYNFGLNVGLYGKLPESITEMKIEWWYQSITIWFPQQRLQHKTKLFKIFSDCQHSMQSHIMWGSHSLSRKRGGKKNLTEQKVRRCYEKTERTEGVHHVDLLSIQNKSLAERKKIPSPQTCVTDDLQQFATSVRLNQQCRTTDNSDVISKQWCSNRYTNCVGECK
jgi:hypothetical protein